MRKADKIREILLIALKLVQTLLILNDKIFIDKRNNGTIKFRENERRSMDDMVKQGLKKGLLGANAHRNTREAIKNLTAEVARQKGDLIFHSSWDLLHHIVNWQEAILDALEQPEGKTFDWKEIGTTSNWPLPSQFTEDANFETLKRKFENGLVRAEKLIDNIVLDQKYQLWQELSGFEALLALIQHNSYHIGQLIMVRKMQANWHLDDWVI